MTIGVLALAGCCLVTISSRKWTSSAWSTRQTSRTIRVLQESHPDRTGSLIGVSQQSLHFERYDPQTHDLVAPPGDQASLRARRLQPGETMNYGDYRLVKLEADEVMDPQRAEGANSLWRQEVRRFLAGELGPNLNAFRAYIRIYKESFDPYLVKTRELEEDIARNVGSDMAVLLEGDLKQLHDASLGVYERRLKMLLGSKGFKRFSDFRDRYASVMLDQFGFLPDEMK